MKKYRLTEIEKKGYYKYYQVQERVAFFFWWDIGRLFDTISQAYQWLEDHTAVETRTILEG